MRDFQSIDQFLKDLEPRVRSGDMARDATRVFRLFEETVEELRVAVEELRVTEEAMLTASELDGESQAWERDAARLCVGRSSRQALAITSSVIVKATSVSTNENPCSRMSIMCRFAS